jgi:hypothetical protein
MARRTQKKSRKIHGSLEFPRGPYITEQNLSLTVICLVGATRFMSKSPFNAMIGACSCWR